jgi:hypothetical protein
MLSLSSSIYYSHLSTLFSAANRCVRETGCRLQGLSMATLPHPSTGYTFILFSINPNDFAVCSKTKLQWENWRRRWLMSKDSFGRGSKLMPDAYIIYSMILASFFFRSRSIAPASASKACTQLFLLNYSQHLTRGILLSPDFSQIGSWAVIEMGLEDMHIKCLWIGLLWEFGLDCPCVCTLW